MKNNQAKYPEIAEELLSRIKQHHYEGKLPPVRNLAAEFAVSTRTMQKALTQLINAERILPDGVNGNRINYQKRKRRKNGIICIFVSHAVSADDPLTRELLLLIKHSGYQVMLANMPDLNKMSHYETVSRMPVDGFIFLYSTIREKLCEVLTLADIPFVSGNQLPGKFPGPWCDFDFKEAYRQMLKALAAAGICRIALHDLPHFSNNQEWIRAVWKELMEEFRIPRRFRYPVLGKRSSNTLESDFDAHLEEWFSRRFVPQAIVCRSQAASYFASKVEERFGLKVPDDVKIFEIDKGLNSSYPAVGRICFNTPYNELAHGIWELFQRKMNGEIDTFKTVAATFEGIICK